MDRRHRGTGGGCKPKCPVHVLVQSAVPCSQPEASGQQMVVLCLLWSSEQSAHYVLQDCLNHQRLRRDSWPEAPTMQSKLYGTIGDLRRTALFTLLVSQCSHRRTKRRRRQRTGMSCRLKPLIQEHWFRKD